MDRSSDQLSIDTPELVAIEMPLAGIGSRFIAVLIDTAIWLGGMAVLWLALFLLLPGIVRFSKPSGQWAVAIYVFLLFLVFWGYFTLFEAFWNGRTPGKRIARIRVIKTSGRPIGLFESMARNLIRPLDLLPGCYAVGVIAMFVTRQHQRLGDLAAGTLVVRDRIQEPAVSGTAGRTFTSNIFPAPGPLPEPHAGLSLPDDGIARLSAKDLEVLEGFFSRRLDMPLATREVLARRIAGAIQAKSGLEPPSGASTETFLEVTARQLRDVARLR